MTTLVCVLGRPMKGSYATASYSFKGQLCLQSRCSPLTALVELCKPQDVIALCTPEAEESYSLAHDELTELGLISPERLQMKKVKLPRTSEDFRDLFNEISSIKPSGKSVHLDITFGLRSLTIYSLLAGGVLESLGSWTIERLTYVNLEARPPEDDVVPIVDITSHLYLSELARSIREFEQRGNIGSFIRAAGRVLGAKSDELIGKDLRQLEQDIDFLRIRSITRGPGRTAILRLIEELRKEDRGEGIFVEMAERAERILGKLLPAGGVGQGSPAHLVGIIRWYAEHDRPDSALLLVCEAAQFAAWVPILSNSYPPEGAFSAAKRFRDAMIAAGDPRTRVRIEQFYALWRDVKKARDSLAHASLIDQQQVTISKLDILKYVARLEKLVT